MIPIKLTINIPEGVLVEAEETFYREAFEKMSEPNVGQVSLLGISVEVSKTGILVRSFILNGSDEPVHLKPATLYLLSGEQKKLTNLQVDDWAYAQELPPKSATPLSFIMPYLTEIADTDLEQWTLTFEPITAAEHQMDWRGLDESRLPENFKKQLEAIVHQKDFDENELAFTGLDMRPEENGTLSLSLLASNATRDHLVLKQLSITLADQDGEEIASGTFMLEDFDLQPNTTRPLLLNYPESSVRDDLSSVKSWTMTVHSK